MSQQDPARRAHGREAGRGCAAAGRPDESPSARGGYGSICQSPSKIDPWEEQAASERALHSAVASERLAVDPHLWFLASRRRNETVGRPLVRFFFWGGRHLGTPLIGRSAAVFEAPTFVRSRRY